MNENPWALIVLGCVILFFVYRWVRMRRQLFRITEKVDDALRRQGLPSVDLFRTPKLRRHLSLPQIAGRLEQRVDRFLAEPEGQNEAGTGKSKATDN